MKPVLFCYNTKAAQIRMILQEIAWLA